jgi:hypothetical protein
VLPNSGPDHLKPTADCTPPGTNPFKSVAAIMAEVACASAAVRMQAATPGTPESPVLWLKVDSGRLEQRYSLDGALQFGPECVAPGEMALPQGPPVKINLTAGDAIYEVRVPGLSLKADAMPGRITSTSMTVSQTGRHEGRIIPDGRTNGRAFTVRILPPREYAAWERRTLRSKGCGRR